MWWLILFLCYFLWNGSSVTPPELTIFPKLSLYYYSSLQEKVKESISIHFCKQTNFNKIQIQILLGSKSVTEHWNHIQNLVTYHGVSQTLCESSQFREYRKRFQGCFHPPPKHQGLKIRAVTHFHSDHPRCHNSRVLSYCVPQAKIFPMKPSKIAFQQSPFLINTTRPVMTSRSGMLVMKCGVLGLYNSCKAHSSGLYATMLDGPVTKGNNATLCYPSNSKPLHCPFPSVDILFIASQYDDTQIGQVCDLTLIPCISSPTVLP